MGARVLINGTRYNPPKKGFADHLRGLASKPDVSTPSGRVGFSVGIPTSGPPSGYFLDKSLLCDALHISGDALRPYRRCRFQRGVTVMQNRYAETFKICRGIGDLPNAFWVLSQRSFMELERSKLSGDCLDVWHG